MGNVNLDFTNKLYPSLISKDGTVKKTFAENILATPGKGAEIAFSTLDMGRFKLGCSCLGGSKLVIDAVAEYAYESLVLHELLESSSADMPADTTHSSSEGGALTRAS